jgi:threonine/homoserine/homoserine lactone efflux protein
MDINLFLKGLLLGFSIAAPVGPIGVLCIRRTLNEGRTAGLVSGLGAATADGFYGLVAGFGLTAISDLMIEGQFWLALIGGTYLSYLGAKTFTSKPAEGEAKVKNNGLLGSYFSTLFLTLTNPITILSFVAIFAGLGLVSGDNSYPAAISLVSGVFLGSGAWWIALSGVVSIFREKFNLKALVWVNRVAGVVLAGYGILALISAFRGSV